MGDKAKYSCLRDWMISVQLFSERKQPELFMNGINQFEKCDVIIIKIVLVFRFVTTIY